MGKPLTSFGGDERTNFDAITSEINSRDTMKKIEDVIESKRKEIFDILSDSRIDCKNTEFKASLVNMQTALNNKKDALEAQLGAIADFDISGQSKNNEDLVKYCKSIYAPKDSTKVDTALATKCADLLSYLQKIYNQGGSTEKLFSGKKDDAADSLNKLIASDRFQKIMRSKTDSSLQSNTDDFMDHVLIGKDNSFGIASSKLYSEEQAKVAARIAVFLHCMQKALKEGRVTDIGRVQTIINVLENEQIPKIRGLFNLQKEQKAVDAELATLIDLEKNDNADIQWTEAAPKIDLTDSFEGKSTDKAKNMDFYNLSKEDIKIQISGTEYTKDDVVLKDSSGEKTELNIDAGRPSGDFDLCVKINGHEVKVGKINIDYEDTKKGTFTLTQDPDAIKNLTAALGTAITGDVDLSIPIMAVKKVTPVKNTGQISLTRNIVAKIKAGGGGPTPIPPVTVNDLEIDATISDMGTDVLKEKVAHDVEEELRKEYKGIAKGNVFKRAYFFLARGQMRNKRVKKKLAGMSGKAFTGDTAIDAHTQNAADRHELEKLKGLDADIKNIDETSAVVYQSPEINDLCKKYIQTWGVTPMSDSEFQTKFNEILERDANLKDELNKANVTHMGTNILLKMKQKVARKDLIGKVSLNLNNYDSTKSDVYIDNINIDIQNYIRNYQDNSKDLMDVYNDYLGDKSDATKLDNLKRYLSHQQSVMALTTNNIKIKLDIIKGGKSAYQIDNKDREKSWKYKLGNWMDKHPLWTTVGTVGASIGLGALTGGLGAVAGAIVTTAGFAGIVGTTNAVKKWTHHTKEQNTHEKDLVSDHANEMRKVQERIDTVNNGRGWKKYKAKRQLKLYHETTQSNIQITNIISNEISNISSKVGALTPDDENRLKYNLIEGRARLKYYKEVGHNFLASNDKSKTEEDFNKLEKSLYLGTDKLGATDLSDIESYSAQNNLSRTVSFNDIYNAIKDDFEKTDKTFRKQRRRLSVKYGVGTALLSAGTAIGMQYITGTGVFAKPTPGTPGYASTNTLTDNFELGKHELLDTGVQNNIYNNTQSAITSAPSGSTINIHYGAGTDATGFIHTPPTATDLATKVSTVNSNISSMTGLSAADKASFMAEVSSLGGGTGTNGVLQNMRQAEFLEQAARALSDSGQSGHVTVSLIHDTGLDVVGTHTHDIGERVVNGMIEVTKAEVPGQPAKTWGRWLMGAPTFFNTFKDREAA